MLRKTIAAVSGIALAIMLVAALEALGHFVYPPPSAIDFADKAAMQSYFADLPLGAFMSLIFAWVAATFGGGLLASFVARDSTFKYCVIVGGFVLVGVIFNLVSIPHPTWFSIVAPIAIVLAIFLTGKVAAGLFSARANNSKETLQT